VRQIEVRSLRELYRRKIGLNVSLDSGKIKDLKVTNGHVFERHIPPSTYSHWAFGDVDVVYGDLGRFLTGPALAYDVLTFRGEDTCDKRTRTLFAGQLTAFANTPRTRALYRSVPGWERALLAPAFVFLDERLLPAHAMRKQPGDVALLIAQLTDRFGQAAGSRTRVLWAEGRLLLLSGGWCWARRRCSTSTSSSSRTTTARSPSTPTASPSTRGAASCPSPPARRSTATPSRGCAAASSRAAAAEGPGDQSLV